MIICAQGSKVLSEYPHSQIALLPVVEFKDWNWREEATHGSTLLGVYSQLAFRDCIVDTVESIVGKVDVNVVVPIQCREGCSVVGRTLKDAVNSIAWSDGFRPFNAQHFALWELEDDTEVENNTLEALQWVTGQCSKWNCEPVPSPVYAHKTIHVAAKSASRRLQGGAAEAAKDAFDYIYAFIATIGGPRDFGCLGLEEPVLKKPRGRGSVVQAGIDSFLGKKIALAKQAAVASGSAKEEWQSPRGVAQEWQTSCNDVLQWKHVLVQYEVDEAARHAFFLLAQLPYYGESEANTIITLLMKKYAAGEYIRNPSGFVHSMCLKARQSLQQRLLF